MGFKKLISAVGRWIRRVVYREPLKGPPSRPLPSFPQERPVEESSALEPDPLRRVEPEEPVSGSDTGSFLPVPPPDGLRADGDGDEPGDVRDKGDNGADTTADEPDPHADVAAGWSDYVNIGASVGARRPEVIRYANIAIRDVHGRRFGVAELGAPVLVEIDIGPLRADSDVRDPRPVPRPVAAPR